MDTEMRAAMDKYNQICQLTAKKGKGGSFLSADLNQIIYSSVEKGTLREEDFVPSSSFLINMLVVVNQRKEKEFLETYSQLPEDADGLQDIQIVPGSALKLPEQKDKEGNLLFRVVLFQKYENSNLPR